MECIRPILWENNSANGKLILQVKLHCSIAEWATFKWYTYMFWIGPDIRPVNVLPVIRLDIRLFYRKSGIQQKNISDLSLKLHISTYFFLWKKQVFETTWMNIWVCWMGQQNNTFNSIPLNDMLKDKQNICFKGFSPPLIHKLKLCIYV